MRYRRLAAFAGGLLLCASAAAQSYHPAFSPRALKGPRAGPPNEVLVLGTPHLSGLPAAFDARNLELLLRRLAVWGPRAIAIEAISGAQCDFLRRYPSRYKDSVEAYCWDPSPARAATGLDVAAATAEADRLLQGWPASPAAGQRRRLAAVFLAGGDGASALVQWLRLPTAERRAGDGLDQVLTARLGTLARKRDESMLVAAELAARLGLERVYPVDDHSADSSVADEKAYGAAITRAWNNPATARRAAQAKALETAIGTPAGVLAMYRAYNMPEAAMLAFRSDFGAALEEPSPQRFGRGYLGYWETRNLRMAANIRDMLAARPGLRALVVVGASHKGYLEAYLDQMHDVRLVDAAKVLR